MPEWGEIHVELAACSRQGVKGIQVDGAGDFLDDAASQRGVSFCGNAVVSDPRTDSNLTLQRKHCDWGSPSSGHCLERQ